MRLRSKKGQLPFIELNGEEIADSSIIIKELSSKYEKDLDSGLTNEQKNVSYAMTTMLENHLIWVIFYWRAKYPDFVLKGYKVNLQHALGLRLPNAILNFFFKIAFGRKVRTLLFQILVPQFMCLLFLPITAFIYCHHKLLSITFLSFFICPGRLVGVKV